MRVIFMMPKDRQPSNPQEYAAKVEAATLRIRASVETLSQYISTEVVKWGADGQGRGPNWERDENGKIRVLVVNGTMPTLDYWGDPTGFASGTIYWEAYSDIFGSIDETVAASAKTVHLIVFDGLTVDATDPLAPVWRGYVGGGAQMGAGSSGYGGCSLVTYGAFESLPVPVSDDEDGWNGAFLSGLCDAETIHQIGNYRGIVVGAPPSCSANRALNRTELISIYQGVLAHELMHCFGLGHDALTYNSGNGVMGVGYQRYGEVVREILGLTDCLEVLLTSLNCPSGELGPTFAHRLAISPYFHVQPDPDKTDPTLEVAWPPTGQFYNITAATEFEPHEFRLVASDGVGRLVDSGILYEGGWSRDYRLAQSDRFTLYFQDNYYNPMEGRRAIDLQVVDSAGNIKGTTLWVFGRVDVPYGRNSVWFNSVWVRRPASEDTRPRDASRPLGSFANPYSDIQQAMDVSIGQNKSAVMIGEGVWPITTPLTPHYRLAMSGEGVGRTILDGQGVAQTIIVANGSGSVLQEGYVSNLVFRNAGNGIVDLGADTVFHFGVTNCIFMDLNGTAIQLSGAAGNLDISQNTVTRCVMGIRVTGYSPFVPNDQFRFMNNLVVNCEGIGLGLIGIAGLDTNPRVGGNLSFGNGADWWGSGSGQSGYTYTSIRRTGEISADPRLIDAMSANAADLRPGSGSPALRAGLAPTENRDGSRRDIGAWIDNPYTVPGNVWMIYGGP
ncbi:hypothetical protein GC173_17560 [bacterium]|nr:hypothetical protein [bacterium]